MSFKHERSPIALPFAPIGVIGDWSKSSTSSPISTPVVQSPRGAAFASPKSPLSFPSFPSLSMPSTLDIAEEADDNDETTAMDTNASSVINELLGDDGGLLDILPANLGQMSSWASKEEGVFAFDSALLQAGGDLELSASLSSSPPTPLADDADDSALPARRRLSVHDQLSSSADEDVGAAYWQAQAMLDQEEDQQYQRSLDEFIAYTEEMEAAAATAAAASSGPPVCRYHLKGKCLRADCWYSHDLKAITCKYWMSGGCLKGDNCEFRHAYTMNSGSPGSTSSTSPPSPPGGNGYYSNGAFYEGSASSPHGAGFYGNAFWGSANGDGSSPPNGAGPSNEFQLSEDQFPELGIPSAPSDKKSRRSSGGASGGSSAAESLDLASRLKLRELQKHYHGVLKGDYIADLFISRKCSLDDTKTAIRTAYPGIDDYVRARQQAANTAAADRAAMAAGAAGANGSGSANHSSPPKHGPKAATRWVDTGDSVAGQFQDARSEAIRHAVLRNRLFDEATKAYLSGNRAAAKELSRRGRMHHERMQALHANASEKIFTARNPELNGGNGNGAVGYSDPLGAADGVANGAEGAASPYVVDLHGLHVKEAVEKLSGVVASRLETGQWPHLYVIIGTGHHSWNKKSKIGPPVLKMLADRGCVYTDSSTDGRGGLLKVALRKKRG